MTLSKVLCLLHISVRLGPLSTVVNVQLYGNNQKQIFIDKRDHCHVKDQCGWILSKRPEASPFLLL